MTWVWYDNEEVEASLNGLGRIARTRPDLLAADFAILAEPTDAEIEGGCNGTLRVEVRTRGRRAHSARSWAGDNAIHSAAPILALLAGYQAREIEVDGLVYREGLNAVGISGGVAGNVIPDECVVTVNYRFAPDKTGAEAEAYVREVCSPGTTSPSPTSPTARVPDSTIRWRRGSSPPSGAKPGPSTAGRTSRGSRPSASRPSTTGPATRHWPTPTTSACRSSTSSGARRGCERG